MACDEKWMFEVLEAHRSGIKCPIFFDDVWQEIGFKVKHNIRRTIRETFNEFDDYIVLSAYDIHPGDKDSLSGYQRSILKRTDCIKISIDTFKHLCYLTRDKSGNNIRKFFIEYERAYNSGLYYDYKKSADNDLITKLSLENDELKTEIYNLKNELSIVNHKVFKERREYISDRKRFSRTIYDLLEISGISIYDYLRNACIEELTPEIDYKYSGDGTMMMTRYAMAKMLIILRSDNGVLMDRVPDVKFSLRELIKTSTNRKINRRSPQSR